MHGKKTQSEKTNKRTENRAGQNQFSSFSRAVLIVKKQIIWNEWFFCLVSLKCIRDDFVKWDLTKNSATLFGVCAMMTSLEVNIERFELTIPSTQIRDTYRQIHLSSRSKIILTMILTNFLTQHPNNPPPNASHLTRP